MIACGWYFGAGAASIVVPTLVCFVALMRAAKREPDPLRHRTRVGE